MACRVSRDRPSSPPTNVAPLIHRGIAMKMAAIFLCDLSLSLTACPQDVSSARCDSIAQLDARVSEWRERLADLQHRPLTDQTTPQIVRGHDLVERNVVAVKEALAQAEAVR